MSATKVAFLRRQIDEFVRNIPIQLEEAGDYADLLLKFGGVVRVLSQQVLGQVIFYVRGDSSGHGGLG